MNLDVTHFYGGDMNKHLAAFAVFLLLFCAAFPASAAIDIQKSEGMQAGEPAQDQTAGNNPAAVIKCSALLIGIDDYTYWPKLINPAGDAEAVGAELRDAYGFDTKLLRDPDKKTILTSIMDLQKKKYADNEELLILYSGQSYYDVASSMGFIVGKDGKRPDDDVTLDTLIDYHRLTRMINNIPCRHILLVVDASYAGTLDEQGGYRGLDRSSINRMMTDLVNRKLKYTARLYLASCGREPAPDGKPGGHSPFIDTMLYALKQNGGYKSYLTLSEMVSVHMDRIEPLPQSGGFYGNAPGSEFFFIPVSKDR